MPYAKAIISARLSKLNLKARYGNAVGIGMVNASICTALIMAANDSKVKDDDFAELQNLAEDAEDREFWRRHTLEDIF